MGGAGDGGAAAARTQENQRQGLANMWSQEVRNIFEGGTQTMYNPASGIPQAGTDYYKQNDKGGFSMFKPNMGTATEPAHQVTQNVRGQPSRYWIPARKGTAPAKLGNNVFTASTSTQPGYGADFYNKIKDDTLAETLPQFNTQLGQTQNSLMGSMADRGLLNSSVMGQKSDLLSAYANSQKQGLIDAASDRSNQLKQSMTQQENNLVNQVLASSDPASAAAGAISTASSFSAPPALAPLGQLFQNFSNAYLVNQAAQPAGTPGGYYAPGGYSPFSSGMPTGYIPRQ